MKQNLGQQAKQKLAEFIPEINARVLNLADREMGKKYGFNNKQKELVKEMLVHTREFVLRPQKKLRPSFVYYGYKLGNGEINEAIWRAAMGVDLIHAALLMHDDFMDQDAFRRGGPTTHTYFKDKYDSGLHFGEAMAVTLGDALLCWGFELVAESGNNLATLKVLEGIKETAYGQAFDLELEQLKKWTEDDVLTLHWAKTGIYTYENPLFIGGYLAGLPENVLKILHEYSRFGGVAFQLQDDILGVFGNIKETGKSVDSDLLEGKCTLLTLKTLELGTPGQKSALKKVWGKGKSGKVRVSVSDLDAAKQAIMDSGAYEYSKRKAKELAWQAVDEAAKLNDLGLNKDAIDYIQGIAEYMVEREV